VCGNAQEEEEAEVGKQRGRGRGSARGGRGMEGERAESLSFGRLTSKGSFVA